MRKPLGFLGCPSLRPKGRPIFLVGIGRDSSRCHVSFDHVLPVQMSRTAFSLTPYSLAIAADFEIVPFQS